MALNTSSKLKGLRSLGPLVEEKKKEEQSSAVGIDSSDGLLYGGVWRSSSSGGSPLLRVFVGEKVERANLKSPPGNQNEKGMKGRFLQSPHFLFRHPNNGVDSLGASAVVIDGETLLVGGLKESNSESFVPGLKANLSGKKLSGAPTGCVLGDLIIVAVATSEGIMTGSHTGVLVSGSSPQSLEMSLSIPFKTPSCPSVVIGNGQVILTFYDGEKLMICTRNKKDHQRWTKPVKVAPKFRCSGHLPAALSEQNGRLFVAMTLNNGGVVCGTRTPQGQWSRFVRVGRKDIETDYAPALACVNGRMVCAITSREGEFFVAQTRMGGGVKQRTAGVVDNRDRINPPKFISLASQLEDSRRLNKARAKKRRQRREGRKGPQKRFSDFREKRKEERERNQGFTFDRDIEEEREGQVRRRGRVDRKSGKAKRRNKNALFETKKTLGKRKHKKEKNRVFKIADVLDTTDDMEYCGTPWLLSKTAYVESVEGYVLEEDVSLKPNRPIRLKNITETIGQNETGWSLTLGVIFLSEDEKERRLMEIESPSGAITLVVDGEGKYVKATFGESLTVENSMIPLKIRELHTFELDVNFVDRVVSLSIDGICSPSSKGGVVANADVSRVKGLAQGVIVLGPCRAHITSFQVIPKRTFGSEMQGQLAYRGGLGVGPCGSVVSWVGKDYDVIHRGLKEVNLDTAGQFAESFRSNVIKSTGRVPLEAVLTVPTHLMTEENSDDAEKLADLLQERSDQIGIELEQVLSSSKCLAIEAAFDSFMDETNESLSHTTLVLETVNIGLGEGQVVASLFEATREMKDEEYGGYFLKLLGRKTQQGSINHFKSSFGSIIREVLYVGGFFKPFPIEEYLDDLANLPKPTFRLPDSIVLCPSVGKNEKQMLEGLEVITKDFEGWTVEEVDQVKSIGDDIAVARGACLVSTVRYAQNHPTSAASDGLAVIPVQEFQQKLPQYVKRSLDGMLKENTQYESHLLTGSFLICSVQAGRPGQVVNNVVIDTSSSDTWLATAEVPGLGSQYRPNESFAHSLVDDSPFTIEYGSGSVIGWSGADDIRIGEKTSKMQTIGEIVRMAPELKKLKIGGVLGFSRTSFGYNLEVSEEKLSSRVCLLDSLVEQEEVSDDCFSLYVSDGQEVGVQSEIVVGGFLQNHFVGEMTWAPLVIDDLYGFEIDEIEINGVKMGSGMKAIVDTSCSLITSPGDCAESFKENLVPGIHNLNVTIEGKTFTITPAQYTIPIRKTVLPAIGRTPNDLAKNHQVDWVFGLPFLKAVYTVFDRRDGCLGFAKRRAIPTLSSPSHQMDLSIFERMGVFTSTDDLRDEGDDDDQIRIAYDKPAEGDRKLVKTFSFSTGKEVRALSSDGPSLLERVLSQILDGKDSISLFGIEISKPEGAEWPTVTRETLNVNLTGKVQNLFEIAGLGGEVTILVSKAKNEKFLGYLSVKLTNFCFKTVFPGLAGNPLGDLILDEVEMAFGNCGGFIKPEVVSDLVPGKFQFSVASDFNISKIDGLQESLKSIFSVTVDKVKLAGTFNVDIPTGSDPAEVKFTKPELASFGLEGIITGLKVNPDAGGVQWRTLGIRLEVSLKDSKCLSKFTEGDFMFPGNYLLSPNKAYKFELKEDGNLCASLVSTGEVYWQSNSRGGVAPFKATVISGRISVLDARETPVWSCLTGWGVAPYSFKIADNRTILLHDSLTHTYWYVQPAVSPEQVQKDVEGSKGKLPGPQFKVILTSAMTIPVGSKSSLDLDCSFELDTGTKSAKVHGTLAKWKNAFGVTGLNLDTVNVKFEISNGDWKSIVMEAFAIIKIDLTPENSSDDNYSSLALYGKISKDGGAMLVKATNIDFDEVKELLARLSGGSSALPDDTGQNIGVKIEDAYLSVATQDTTINDVEISEGLTVFGKVKIKDNASANGKISITKHGLEVEAKLDSNITVAPGIILTGAAARLRYRTAKHPAGKGIGFFVSGSAKIMEVDVEAKLVYDRDHADKLLVYGAVGTSKTLGQLYQPLSETPLNAITLSKAGAMYAQGKWEGSDFLPIIGPVEPFPEIKEGASFGCKLGISVPQLEQLVGRPTPGLLFTLRLGPPPAGGRPVLEGSLGLSGSVNLGPSVRVEPLQAGFRIMSRGPALYVRFGLGFKIIEDWLSFFLEFAIDATACRGTAETKGLWKNAFGIKGLCIGDIGIIVGLTFATVAARGPDYFGLKATVKLGTDPKDPEIKLAGLYSDLPHEQFLEGGLSPKDAVLGPKELVYFAGEALQLDLKPVMDKIPTVIQYRNVHVMYKPPFAAFRGTLVLFKDHEFTINVTLKETGFFVAGSIPSIKIGPLAITGVDGKGDPRIAAEISASAQFFRINAQAQLFSIMAAIDMDVSTPLDAKFLAKLDVASITTLEVHGKSILGSSGYDFELSAEFESSFNSWLIDHVKNKTTAAIKAVKGDIESAQKKLEEAKKNYAELVGAAQRKLDEEQAKFDQAVAAARAHVEVVRKEEQAKVDRLKGSLDAKQAELDRLVAEAQAKIQHQQAECDRKLREAQAHLQNVRNEWNLKISAAHQDVRSAEAAFQRARDDANNKLNAARGPVNSLQWEINNCHSNIARLNSEKAWHNWWIIDPQIAWWGAKLAGVFIAKKGADAVLSAAQIVVNGILSGASATALNAARGALSIAQKSFNFALDQASNGLNHVRNANAQLMTGVRNHLGTVSRQYGQIVNVAKGALDAGLATVARLVDEALKAVSAISSHLVDLAKKGLQETIRVQQGLLTSASDVLAGVEAVAVGFLSHLQKAVEQMAQYLTIRRIYFETKLSTSKTNSVELAVDLTLMGTNVTVQLLFEFGNPFKLAMQLFDLLMKKLKALK